ncbi:MAG: site-specific integrase [Stagnimonas sp.]|nr:site-specific integrase [Stagnimonas sp.]
MTTWGEAADRWLEVNPQLSKAWRVKMAQYIGRLRRWIGDLPVDQVHAGQLQQARAKLLAMDIKPVTVNHYMACALTVLRSAVDFGEISRVPRIRKLRTETRERWLEPEEAQRLLAALPDYMRQMALFALETGLRRGNVCRLRWEHVNWSRSLVALPSSLMKNRRPLWIPLSPGALAVLQAQRGQHDEWVFTWRGAPLAVRLPRTWSRALATAGLQDLRWHDLRHTWASWQTQDGVPDNALQTLGGWECPAMVKRYAHHSVEHLRPWVQRQRRLQLPMAA